MQTLRTEISRLASGSPVPGWWHGLFSRAGNASAFLSRPWLETWLASYGAAFDGHWFSCWLGDDCVAGCLLLLRRAKVGPVPVRLAVVNTAAEEAEESPWVEYNDVLCIDGFQDEVATLLVKHLRALSWDQLCLSGYIAGGVMSRLAHQSSLGHLDFLSKPSPYVDLTKLDERGADGVLSSNSRSQIKRSMRLYAARGELHVNAASTLEQAHLYLSELARLHHEGWARRGLPGGFRTKPFMDFHRRLVAALWDDGGAVILRAAAGEHAFAYLYNFLHAGKIYFYQSGFAYEEDAKLKPGLVAHYLAINHFRAHEVREYDFMAGSARYKASLANAERTLEWSWVERDNLRMRAVRVARTLKHRFSRDRQDAIEDATVSE